MLNALKSLFSSSKVVDTGLRIVERITGTDEMTPKEKGEFLLQYQAATKHQSPARRFIALGITFMYLLFSLMVVVLVTIGNLLSFEEAVSAGEAVFSFMKEILFQPMNLIIGFYFTVQLASGLRK